jgi:hypothetical protein
MNKKHSFAVLAFLRKVKSAAEGFAGVYIRITFDSAPSEISTRINVPKDKMERK